MRGGFVDFSVTSGHGKATHQARQLLRLYGQRGGTKGFARAEKAYSPQL